eukprot:SM003993S14699  [mRNA]  locus=s3993:1:1206:- [translate_table: standard]
MELDVIRLTAQLAARNGKGFLAGLASREHANLQFHFLRPSHSLFPLFAALADAYSRVLMPPKGTLERLRADAADPQAVLARCLGRLEWERTQRAARKAAEDEAEQERERMALVDWHDFVVVETIDFADVSPPEPPLLPCCQTVAVRSWGQRTLPGHRASTDLIQRCGAQVQEEEGDLPQPLSREEVIRLSRQAVEDEPEEPAPPAEKPAAAAAAAAGAMDADEVAMVQASLGAATLDGKDGAGDTAAAAAEQHDEDEEDEEMEIEEDGYIPPPPPEDDGPVKIVRNYKRPEERAAAEAAAEGEPASAATQFVVSPITGELVSVAEMAEHMRVSLIDPKYKEQKERMMAKLRENTLASDDEISRNINHLATTRPDIFGTTEEEVSNAVRAESEKLSAVAAAAA